MYDEKIHFSKGVKKMHKKIIAGVMSTLICATALTPDAGVLATQYSPDKRSKAVLYQMILVSMIRPKVRKLPMEQQIRKSQKHLSKPSELKTKIPLKLLLRTHHNLLLPYRLMRTLLKQLLLVKTLQVTSTATVFSEFTDTVLCQITP